MWLIGDLMVILFGWTCGPLDGECSSRTHACESRPSSPLRPQLTLDEPPMDRQDRIDHGELIRWTKGFGAPNTEGKDVAEMFRSSLKKYVRPASQSSSPAAHSKPSPQLAPHDPPSHRTSPSNSPPLSTIPPAPSSPPTTSTRVPRSPSSSGRGVMLRIWRAWARLGSLRIWGSMRGRRWLLIVNGCVSFRGDQC